MFLTFAGIKFQGIKLPQSFDGSNETIYGEIPIIGGKAVIQGTGEKLDEYDITALFHVEFCNPREEVDALQEVRAKNVVDYLVDGTGRNYGKFVITTLTASILTALDNGFPTAIQVQLHFKEYNTNANSVKQTGAALTSQNPLPEVVITAKGSSYATVKLKGFSINESMSSGVTQCAGISDQITSNPTPSDGKYKSIGEMAKNAQSAFETANSKIESTKKIVYRAIHLQDSITMINSALQEIRAAASAKKPNDLLTANNKLSDSLLFMNKSYAPVAAFIGSREGGE